MGLDMYLFKYNKAENLKKLSYSEKEIEYGENSWVTFSTCRKGLESIATKISVERSFFDMEKISKDFANGEPLVIGMMSNEIIGFRNYEKNIRLDLNADMIFDKYTYLDKGEEYAVEEEEIAYWRKANQVRQWFVNHIKEFNCDDNNCHYKVTKELLEELIADCTSVLLSQEEVTIPEKIMNKMNKVKKLSEKGIDGEKAGAKEILKKLEKKYGLTGIVVKPEKIMPTSEGFFFGNTEYNEYYFEQLKDTIRIISNILKTVDWDNDIVMYYESW